MFLQLTGILPPWWNTVIVPDLALASWLAVQRGEYAAALRVPEIAGVT